MSEKTYDAIYKIAKNAESDILVLWLGHGAEIRGTLLDCNDNKCQNDIITLQDAVIKCHHHGEEEVEEKYVKWVNIPACHIKAFTFKCCLMDD